MIINQHLYTISDKALLCISIFEAPGLLKISP